MRLTTMLSSLGFQVTAAFAALVLLFAIASVYYLGAFQRQLAYDSVVDIAGRLELTSQQIRTQAMNYKQNAPRDYPTYYRDVRLYYQDLMVDVETFDQVIDTFMKGDFRGEMHALLPWIRPRVGADVDAAIAALERVWEAYRRGLFEAIGEDDSEPRLEFAAEHIIARHAALDEASRALTTSLRDWTASEYRRLTQGAILMAVAAVLVVAVLLAVLHYRVLGPLRGTIAAIQRVSDGDFRHRLPVDGTAEIRDLTSSFNRLSTRLDLLYRLIDRLQRGNDLDEVIGFLDEEFRDLLGFDWIGVVFVDETRSVARVETSRLDGRAEADNRALYRFEGTLLEAALTHEVPMHVADMEQTARDHPEYELLRHLTAIGLRDAIFLPVSTQTQTPIPAVIVFATRAPGRYDEAQRRFLGNIAHLITHSFGRTARLSEQARLAAVGSFASGIAHELRTPLTTVCMALDHIGRQPLDDRVKKRAELGAQEADRMRRLLEDMLLYAKPLTLELEPLQVAAVIQRYIRGYTTDRDTHPVLLDAVERDAWILADADRLRQIFENLTNNAREAAPAGSPIRWRVESVGTGCIAISVHNEGEPIPARRAGAHDAAVLQHQAKRHRARTRHRAPPGRTARR